jgi:hypothetical protein
VIELALFPGDSWGAVRRGLFEATESYAGEAWGRDVLHPWTAANRATIAALQGAGRPQTARSPLAARDRWTLYAVSRLVELLTAGAQPPAMTPDDECFDRVLPPIAYQEFVAAIGGTLTKQAGGGRDAQPDEGGALARPDSGGTLAQPASGTWSAEPASGRFHPFFHEIVEVRPADDQDESPSVVAQWWPGCFVGSLLLARAGVTVRAGRHHLDPVVATTSTLYWAWTRRHRPVADLSHGWGHNSQWRTGFRRDYHLGDLLAYNVDAALTPRPERFEPELPPNVLVELVRQRCSTIVDHGPDVWVWDGHHTERFGPAGASDR